MIIGKGNNSINLGIDIPILENPIIRRIDHRNDIIENLVEYSVNFIILIRKIVNLGC